MGMKRAFYLTTGVAMALASTAIADGFSDDFESYAIGEDNLEGNGGWQQWCGSAGVNASVVADPDGSGDQAIRADPGDDVVQVFQGVTSGTWVISVDVYMPAFTVGGFTNSGLSDVVTLNTYDSNCGGSGANNWSGTVVFDAGFQTVSSWFGEMWNGTFALDTWGTLTVTVDLDADLHSIAWNGDEFLSGVSWSNGISGNGLVAIECIDLYSASGEIYYDNLSMKPVGGASQAAAAVDVTRTLGIFISGDLAAISASDDVDYVLQTGPGFNPAEPHPARVDVGFDTGGFAASTLDTTIEVGSNIGGPTAVVLLCNFNNGQVFDEIGRGAFGPGDTTTTYAGVPAGDYINGANRAVVRVRSFFIIVLFPTVRGFTNHDFIGLNMNG